MKFSVWTDQPELIFGAEIVAIHPEHLLNKMHGRQTDKSRNMSGIKVVNPLTKELIPIVVSDTVSFPHACQTKLCVPSFNDVHAEIASTLT